jgi:hypothetical protein
MVRLIGQHHSTEHPNDMAGRAAVADLEIPVFAAPATTSFQIADGGPMPLWERAVH